MNLADAVEHVATNARVEKHNLTQGAFGPMKVQALLEKSSSPFSQFRQSPGLSDNSQILAGKSTARQTHETILKQSPGRKEASKERLKLVPMKTDQASNGKAGLSESQSVESNRRLSPKNAVNL